MHGKAISWLRWHVTPLKTTQKGFTLHLIPDKMCWSGVWHMRNCCVEGTGRWVLPCTTLLPTALQGYLAHKKTPTPLEPP